MVIIQICVGSSCHLKGSEDIIELLKNEIAARGLENEVTLAGSFCAGNCNREGVTITVDDEVYTGVTRESFSEFFRKAVLEKSGK